SWAIPLPPKCTTAISAINEANVAATAASTAFPPRANIAAPAAAVSGPPAAITPAIQPPVRYPSRSWFVVTTSVVLFQPGSPGALPRSPSPFSFVYFHQTHFSPFPPKPLSKHLSHPAIPH